ncbi:hypothetical protein L596_028891 [Steinernema carpocapsae]|uniref:Uncharacterized protein n=1 Tax=Steinernema carpocapsae TaxID=34508 RepID=A0A4U5LZN4_STECR|nr:hypothetical protein L596_028891 [Steinernema carpocapsae]
MSSVLLAHVSLALIFASFVQSRVPDNFILGSPLPHAGCGYSSIVNNCIDVARTCPGVCINQGSLSQPDCRCQRPKFNPFYPYPMPYGAGSQHGFNPHLTGDLNNDPSNNPYLSFPYYGNDGLPYGFSGYRGGLNRYGNNGIGFNGYGNQGGYGNAMLGLNNVGFSSAYGGGLQNPGFGQSLNFNPFRRQPNQVNIDGQIKTEK